jgi:hypothetical protein
MEEHSLVPVSLTLHLVVNQDDRASLVRGRNEIHGFLLHRLMVLEAALQRVEEIRRIAADKPTSKQRARRTSPPKARIAKQAYNLTTHASSVPSRRADCFPS